MTSSGSAGPPAFPPASGGVPVNIHHCDAISFLHWPFAPGVVARVLPDGLSVRTWDGAAWVGATPFRIGVRPPGLPPGPRWAYEHTETSVNGEPRNYTLRATQIYRREDGEWKVVHRHGDTVTDSD